MSKNPQGIVELANVVTLRPDLDERDAATLEDLYSDPFMRQVAGKQKVALSDVVGALGASYPDAAHRRIRDDGVRAKNEYDSQILGREAAVALEHLAQTRFGPCGSWNTPKEVARVGELFNNGYFDMPQVWFFHDSLLNGQLNPLDIFSYQLENSFTDNVARDDLGEVTARVLQLERGSEFVIRNKARQLARQGNLDVATTLYDTLLRNSQQRSSAKYRDLALESLTSEFRPARQLALNLASEVYTDNVSEAERIVDTVIGSEKIWKYRQTIAQASKDGEQDTADVISNIIMHKAARGEFTNVSNTAYLTARDNVQSRAVALELAATKISRGEYENARALIKGVQQATLHDDLLFEHAGSKQDIQLTANHSGKESRLYTVMASLSDTFYSPAKLERISKAFDTLISDKHVRNVQLADVTTRAAVEYGNRGQKQDQERAQLLFNKAYSASTNLEGEQRQTALQHLFSRQTMQTNSYVARLAQDHVSKAREEGRFGEARAIEETIQDYILQEAKSQYEVALIDESMSLYEHVLAQNPARARNVFSQEHLNGNRYLIARGLDYATLLHEQGKHELAHEIEGRAVSAIDSIALTSVRRELYRQAQDLFLPDDTFEKKDTGVLPFVQVTRSGGKSDSNGSHFVGAQLYRDAA